FERLAKNASADPAHPQLPEIRQIKTGLVGAIMSGGDGRERCEGSMQDEDGRDYLFRLQKFSQGEEYIGYSLLLAAEGDFAQGVRTLQLIAIVFALIVGGCFIPASWIFGGRMSSRLKR